MFTKGGQDRAAAHPEVVIPGEEADAGKRGSSARKVAVFVAHGMGQQVPFETMDTVAAGLKAIAERKNGPLAAPVRAQTCRIGEEKLQRIEMDLTDEQGRPLEVHIYEGYWAPITEGQVTIRDVMSFLLRGGINGMRNASNNFSRWMFGGPVDFGKRPRTGRRLMLALGVVFSLVVVNFIITVMFADRLAGRISAPSGGGTAVADETFTGLTTLIAGWVGLSLIAVGWLLHVHKNKKQSTGALVFFLKLWLVCTIALGVIALAALAGVPGVDKLGLPVFNRHAVWVWIALLAVSWAIRGIMIQFPGDVAAYVSTHTLDRFQEIRTKIKDAVTKVARAIYSVDEYEGVVWVGHSLGSVVVYDALNAVIMDDQLPGKEDDEASKNGPGVVARTKLLLTFGSPLDKIAFIFGAQLADAKTRDALAASFQPLILDYDKFRNIPWVNIWSPADIISGHLDFFDDPRQAGNRKVENVIDEQATTPLMAHVEYWKNDLLFERMYQGIVREDVAVAGIRKVGG
jgi:hypothetical protein